MCCVRFRNFCTLFYLRLLWPYLPPSILLHVGGDWCWFLCPTSIARLWVDHFFKWVRQFGSDDFWQLPALHLPCCSSVGCDPYLPWLQRPSREGWRRGALPKSLWVHRLRWRRYQKIHVCMVIRYFSVSSTSKLFWSSFGNIPTFYLYHPYPPSPSCPLLQTARCFEFHLHRVWFSWWWAIRCFSPFSIPPPNDLIWRSRLRGHHWGPTGCLSLWDFPPFCGWRGQGIFHWYGSACHGRWFVWTQGYHLLTLWRRIHHKPLPIFFECCLIPIENSELGE